VSLVYGVLRAGFFVLVREAPGSRWFVKVRRFFVGVATVLGTAALAGATTTEALPTGLQPADMVTAMSGEFVSWLSVGIPVIIGLTLLAALVRGGTRKAARPVK
jgi:hypothetical protein